MSRTTLFFGHRFFDRRFTARIAEEAQNGLLQFAVVALAQRIHDLGEPLGHERRIRPGGKFRRHEERARHAFDDAVPGRGDKLRPEVAEFLGGFAFVRGPGDAVDDFLTRGRIGLKRHPLNLVRKIKLRRKMGYPPFKRLF